MKKNHIIIFILLLLSISSEAKTGLLIIAHGSPADAWNGPLRKLETELKQKMQLQNIQSFEKVKLVFMEFAKPSIADGMREFEEEGFESVFVIPLFIAPSGHSMLEIPCILGLLYDKETYDGLRAEGVEMVNTKIKIHLGSSLHQNHIIKNILLDKVKTASENAPAEALIVLAHGDKNFEPFWDKLLNETTNYILANTGIDYADKTYVEIGQSFATEAMPAILKATEKKEKVLVMGMYLSMGVKTMGENSAFFVMGQKIESKRALQNKNIYFEDSGLLPDTRISDWIIAQALDWVNKKI